MKRATLHQQGIYNCHKKIGDIIMRDQRRLAIERDWNRMRDLERQWKRFEMRVGWFAAIVMLIAAIAGLVA